MNELIRKQLIDGRVNEFKERFFDVTAAFEILKAELYNLQCQPMTKVIMDEAQQRVNLFLDINRLKIAVDVMFYEDKVMFMGRTFEDELVWQFIFF